MRLRYALRFALLSSCTLSTTALAQEATPDEGPSDTLKTVIVTGEKTGRSLLDTATSATVLDASDLERRAGLSTTKDILQSMSNLLVVGTGNQAPTVRGVDGTGAAKGADAFFAGSRPRLNVQIDGRPASYNEITFGDSTIWDVDRVEVLRGAQSTLQGRNAIAGTVVTRTKDPTFQTEFGLQAGGGNYDQQRYSGVVSGPIVDDAVAFRLSADYLSKHTFVDGYESFPGVRDPGDFEALNVRGKLLFQSRSIEGLRTLLTLNHSDYTAPQTENVNRPFGDSHSDFRYEPVFEPKTTSLIADTRYTIDPRLTFQAVLSGTDLSVVRLSEPGQGIVNIDGHEYMFEPRLNFTGEGRAAAVAGVYLFRADQDESIDFPSPQVFDDRVTTAAVFGEGTLPLNDTLDLTLGLRLEQEKHERHGGDQTLVRVDLDETYKAFLPKIGLAWHVQEKTTLGIVASRGYNGGGGGFNFDEANGIFTNYQYAPEHVTTVEAYARRELADNRVRLTANVFYSDFRDMQLSYDLTPTDPTDYSFVVKNADRAKSYGAELGAEWLIRPGLEVFGSAGLLSARITQYPNSGFQGNDQPFAPSTTASAGVTWNDPRGWDASLSTRYAGSYYSDIENNPRGKVGPYFVANAQAGYNIGPARLYGRVDNLFDSDEPMAVYSGATEAEDTADVLRPRTYWAGVQLNF